MIIAMDEPNYQWEHLVTVIYQGSDRTVDIQPDDRRLPPMCRVPSADIENTEVFGPGDRCKLIFIDGNPHQPRVIRE